MFAFLLSFCLWIIFNGKLTFEIAIFGVFIAFVIVYIIFSLSEPLRKAEIYALKHPIRILRSLLMGLKYLLYLLKEMYTANITVIKMILSPRVKITPVFYKFKPQISSLKKKVVLADSITLTPGTVTVSLENGVFTVYCLDQSFAAGLDDWRLTRMLEDRKEKL